jgi:hypothetical protein
MAPQQTMVVETKSGWSLEVRSAAIERFLERRQGWILAAWTILYFAGAILQAKAKPFWYDEILTLLEARQSTLTAAIHAGGNADWMPPLSHIIFYLTDKLAGHGEIAFRLAPMIGFWVFCLCLFQFAKPKGIYFGFVALFLPFASRFATYAYEARSYAIVLGFCGIALLGWQSAAEGKRRPVALAALTIGLAGALLNHYWAVFLYLPLAGGEAWRNFRQRKIDWPIWIALALGGLPLLMGLFAILQVVHRNTHPWAQAQLGDYRRFYLRNFRFVVFVLPAAVLLAAWRLLGGQKEKPCITEPSKVRDYDSKVRDYEWLAAALFLLAPLVAITGALIVPPHIYVDRYLALATAGFALLGAFAASRFAARRSAIGCICAIAALSPFISDLRQTPLRPARNPFAAAPLLRQALATQAGPVVVSDAFAFLEIWYYAPGKLKPRILCLSDPQSAVKYQHKDETDSHALGDLGVPFRPYHDFATPGSQFLLFVARPNWITEKVLADGGTLDTLVGSRRGVLLRAHVK